MSRTVMVTLVFTDERHREGWLEKHGLVPPKHGDYKGVAERVDYEHRRDQATLVFTIAPDGPTPEAISAHEAVWQAREETMRAAAKAAHIAPDDHELPFPGRFHKRRLSALDDADLLALHNALTALVNKGADEATHTWLTRIGAWSYYRRGVTS